MKILHIISSADPKQGGPIQGIRNYEAALNNLSVERSLICFETQEDITRWAFPATINVIGLGKSVSKWQYNKQLVPWLKANIENYDKIILNGMWTYHTYATAKLINDLKKRKSSLKLPEVFLMPHGMLDPWFQQANTRRLKALRNFFYWQFIEKKVVNSIDGLLFTCQEELLLSRTTFRGYHPVKEINIGYGISAPPVFVSQLMHKFITHFKISAAKPYLLFLSRIDPKKGLDLLIKAYLHLLLNADGNVIPDLIIVGHGIDTSYGKTLMELIDKHSVLQDSIRFVGQLSGDLKWGAIYGCEAFVLPSHQENFGIAIVEALACSKPVLITKKVNIYKEIEDGQGGIVNEDSIYGTIQSLTTWIELTKAQKQKMSVMARQVYMNHFTMEKTAHNLIEALS